MRSGLRDTGDDGTPERAWHAYFTVSISPAQLLTEGAATGAKLQVTYGMLVVQQSGVKWYVKAISASIEAVGAQ